MMKLIRLFLWICVTVVIAYFLTDLRFGGRTIKQHIDSALNSVDPSLLKKKEAFLTDKTAGSSLNVSESKQGPKEDITDAEAEKLKKLIEEHQ